MGLRKLIVLTASMILSSALFSQADFKKAEKLLELKAFDLAIKNYESALAKDPANAEGFAQLGEAYFMTNQLLDALKVYEKAFSLTDNLNPKYKLQYAQTLKKVGLYDIAESVFFEYAATDQKVANHMLQSTEYAKSLLQKPDEYDIMNYEFNSDKSDFGISFHKDNVIFCSFRDDLKRENGKKNSSYIQRSGNQVFKVAKEGANRDVSFLRPDYKEIYNLGPLSYSKDGRMVAYMRNTFTTGSNQIFSDESNMSIYVALTNEDGDFTDEKPFPYNQVEYSFAFPNLGFNGNALYFASNKPGGMGGFDIYVSYFRDGKWGQPENLGPEVNTAGNEITPFFDGEQLYFASDYHFGLGGYDNFTSSVVDGSWSPAQNLGKGINSPSDDYYLTPDLATEAIYFTSNRLGGRGKDDIYVGYKLMKEQEILAVVTEEVPPAVHLEDLVVKDEVAPMQEQDVTEASVVTVSSSGSATEASTLLDFSDAKLISITSSTADLATAEDEYAEAFFIQLASLTQSDGNMSDYSRLNAYGQLYRFFKSSSVKIRLGSYASRSAAETALRDVKNNGFRDAFITRDILATSNYEILDSNSSAGVSSTGWVDDYNATSNYKVKLASYIDPLKFKVDNVLDLGTLEQWTKGKWTIFILGGYETLDEAKQARIRAKNRGFVDAELVQDELGILTRVKEN